jgi:Mg/Co/Ni transporter MgtE
VADVPELTLAFLQQKPASAARALESLPALDAAELLRHVPVRISAPVVSAMTTIAAARCVHCLPLDLSGALCQSLPWPDASALLRQSDAAHREGILSSLPRATSRRFRRSLDYPEAAVGAWVEMDSAAVEENRTVSEAARLLARIDAFAASHLLLTNSTQQYTGVLPVAALVRANPTSALHVLAERDLRPVRDTATLASVARSEDWDRTTLLPVVNHRGELLGGLTRMTLTRALRNQLPDREAPRPSLPAFLFNAYLVAGEGLLRMLVGHDDERAATEEDDAK